LGQTAPGATPNMTSSRHVEEHLEDVGAALNVVVVFSGDFVSQPNVCRNSDLNEFDTFISVSNISLVLTK
jgi:hypothetical protein